MFQKGIFHALTCLRKLVCTHQNRILFRADVKSTTFSFYHNLVFINYTTHSSFTRLKKRRITERREKKAEEKVPKLEYIIFAVKIVFLSD